MNLTVALLGGMAAFYVLMFVLFKMGAPTGWLFKRRWEDPRHPLYMALGVQVLVAVLVFTAPYAAPAFIGGTVGLCINSLRLLKKAEQRG
jgi:hypothetical protein